MSPGPDIVLVIPCYNEADRAPWAQIQAYLEADQDAALILVDDRSQDGTLGRIRDLRALHPDRVLDVALEHNSGKAEAVRQGVLAARRQWPEARYIGYFDADLATPLSAAREMLAAIADTRPALIMGARINLLGTTRIERDRNRHYFGRVFATVVSAMLDVAVYDTQCGAKLIGAHAAEHLMRDPFLSRWLFDVELLWRCLLRYGRADLGAHVKEMPLRQWSEKGDSRIKPTDLLKVPLELWRIRRLYRPLERRG
jgi:dolichyl-phosphate beta-glucosyltransferase